MCKTNLCGEVTVVHYDPLEPFRILDSLSKCWYLYRGLPSKEWLLPTESQMRLYLMSKEYFPSYSNFRVQDTKKIMQLKVIHLQDIFPVSYEQNV